MEKPIEKPHSVPRTKPKQLINPVAPPPLPEQSAALGGSGGKSPMVAKSPPGTPPGTLGHSDDSAPIGERDDTAARVLTLSGLQVVCAVLMAALGVLSLVHGSAMSRCGAGLWGGLAAGSAGLAGMLAALRGGPLRTTPTTVYLALCLVGMAVTTLALGLTSTGLLRDLRQPSFDLESPATWSPALCSLGLLLIAALLLATLVLAALRVYRLVCPCVRPTSTPPRRLLESPAGSHYAASKQTLVHSWLGQHQQQPSPLLYPAPRPPSGLVVYPPPLMVDSNGMYAVAPSPRSAGVGLGYAPVIATHPVPSHNPYMQRRRSPHPHAHAHPQQQRGRTSITPDSTKRRRQERPRRETPKEKGITDEQLEKTYTGLDREIAEEFIAIAMSPDKSKKGSQRSSASASVSRPGPNDRVIDCIAPI